MIEALSECQFDLQERASSSSLQLFVTTGNLDVVRTLLHHTELENEAIRSAVTLALRYDEY